MSDNTIDRRSLLTGLVLSPLAALAALVARPTPVEVPACLDAWWSRHRDKAVLEHLIGKLD